MEVKTAIEKRRAYRSLEAVEITEELVKDLAHHAQLAPSCFNNQPWQYVFIYDSKILKKMHDVLSTGNAWAYDASMIIAVHCKEADDCIIHDRKYSLFDTGMATALLILRATELGLVAHPIAGYSPKKAREVLNIPEDHEVITLVIVGKHSDNIKPTLSEKQAKDEKNRPQRHHFSEFVTINSYDNRDQFKQVG